MYALMHAQAAVTAGEAYKPLVDILFPSNAPMVFDKVYDILRTLLRDNPADRPTAHELLLTIQMLQEELEPTPPMEPSSTKQPMSTIPVEPLPF